MTKLKTILQDSSLLVVLLYFLVLGLIEARLFLIPLVTAVILALLVLPLSQKMEARRFNRSIASLVNCFFLLIISLGFMAVVSVQLKNVINDWGKIKVTMQPKVEQLKSFILEHTPIREENLDFKEEDIAVMKPEPLSASGPQTNGYFSVVMGFLANFLLTFIYTFFVLNYRRRFKDFLLCLFPSEKNEEVRKIIHRSAEVTQQYLIGKIYLIFILAALYSLGLGFSGVSNFFLISVLAALLSLIPYIGNVIGFGIAMTFGYLTSGDTTILIGILITFSVAQFVESYILEPYIVGDRVDLHPFFVILAVVVGNIIWGVMGMILSIPILAMINVVLLDIPSLRPFGFLLSNKPVSN